MSNSSRVAATVRQARKKKRFATRNCLHTRSCKFFSMLWPFGHPLKSANYFWEALNCNGAPSWLILWICGHRKSSWAIFTDFLFSRSFKKSWKHGSPMGLQPIYPFATARCSTAASSARTRLWPRWPRPCDVPGLGWNLTALQRWGIWYDLYRNI